MIYITRDFDRADSAGAEGMFQVISVIYDGEDITDQEKVGKFYSSGEAVIKDYGFNPATTDWEYDD
ncbi:hypothetical protein [Peribacillus asahii]|uniref:hypothetical protein n=1 Tax=Peribacillus asahii TaxID=228899 RepID=UPI00207A7D0E|nr:hypothetical protein [Peribacillus asahii]USK86143.1 hypothetical protein LIT35_05745 [Peribacillus asahii]